MNNLLIVLLSLTIFSCSAKLDKVIQSPESSTHEIHLRLINEYDIEITRTNKSEEKQYYINDCAYNNHWLLFNKNIFIDKNIKLRGDMDPIILHPSESKKDTFDIYYYAFISSKVNDGKYSFQWSDEQYNTKSNIVTIDYSMIKYNRPKSPLKNFLDIRIDSIDIFTYKITIKNPTKYKIDCKDLDIQIRTASEFPDKNGITYEESFTIPFEELEFETKRTILKPISEISFNYTITSKHITEVQNLVHGTAENVYIGISSSKYPLFYYLKSFMVIDKNKIIPHYEK